jgi:Bor protein
MKCERVIRRVARVGALGVLVGCYHVRVETGLPLTQAVYEDKWATGYLWGLIPPHLVTTAVKCSNGVALFETKHSFLNEMASLVTIGIYTPMEIRVTCASASPPQRP